MWFRCEGWSKRARLEIHNGEKTTTNKREEEEGIVSTSCESDEDLEERKCDQQYNPFCNNDRKGQLWRRNKLINEKKERNTNSNCWKTNKLF